MNAHVFSYLRIMWLTAASSTSIHTNKFATYITNISESGPASSLVDEVSSQVLISKTRQATICKISI